MIWSVFSDFNAPAFRINSNNGGGTIEGDFSGDGSVDAADYVVWRAASNSTGNDYQTWRSHFGATGSSAAAGSLTSVPEPQTLLLAMLGILAGLQRRSDRCSCL